MTAIRSWWLDHGARVLRTYHLASTIGWVVMIPVSIYTGLWRSVQFITLISLWALVATEWGSLQGSRAEVAVTETVAQATNVEHADNVESTDHADKRY